MKKSFHSVRDLRVYLFLSLFVLVIDQASKLLIENGSLKIPFIYNEGAAMGLFRNVDPSIRVPFFKVFSVIAIIVILYYLFTIPLKDKLSLMSLSFILGGAFGNLIDRIIKGKVLDFIETGFWPTFNIADSAISIGVCILVFRTFFSGKNKAGLTDKK